MFPIDWLWCRRDCLVLDGEYVAQFCDQVCLVRIRRWGANCQGLTNINTKNTDKANRSIPTKPDLLLRRSFFQGVAGCRGIDSSEKRRGAAGRLEQVQ